MTVEYVAPRGLVEACVLGREPGSVFVQGCTDVLVWKADGRRQIERVVSLRNVRELRERRREKDGAWYLGAGITHDEVASEAQIRKAFPALAKACQSVGAWSIRVAGTLGGNVCTAAPSADSAGPLLAYGAQVVISDGANERSIPLADFFVGPGVTVLQPGEILKAFVLDDPGSHGSSFIKLGRREAVDLSLVSVTVLVWVDEQHVCRDLRLALGAVAPVPLLVGDLPRIVGGLPLTEDVIEQVAQQATAQCQPISDVRASAGYRRRMVGVLTRRALREAWQRAVTAREEA